MTISWVAEEKPNSTAPMAIMLRLAGECTGSVMAIQQIAAMIISWESSSQLRLLPRRRVRNGNGSRSTRGAQTNLKEYPSAAQLKKVTADRLTPASRSQTESVEKIRRMGIPAENPRNSMATARGLVKEAKESRQP